MPIPETQLAESEIEICKVLSKYYPFVWDDIKTTYKELASFDKTIQALNMSTARNISLSDATKVLTKEN